METTSGSARPNPDRFDDLGERIEEDLKRVIDYLNERVVPEVRQNSSKALRIAADQLNRLAEHLDHRQGG